MNGDSATAASVAVVHLLRQKNDIAHFARFLRSYRRFAAGMPHDLIILFKGFRAGDDSQALARLERLRWVRRDVPDAGYDIGPYIDVARSRDDNYFCFLNSFSEILADDWLAKLHGALDSAERAGVVAATGSWENIGDGTAFPNYHVRTNAFMISGHLFRDLDSWRMDAKSDTSRLEAGPRGLTSQILARGLEPYVVDRHGRAWAKEDWPRANTFRAAGQEGLMVADARAEAYRAGGPEVRAYLRTLAWTDDDPGPSPLKSRGPGRRLGKLLGLAGK